jgi:hypothetical protein
MASYWIRHLTITACAHKRLDMLLPTLVRAFELASTHPIKVGTANEVQERVSKRGKQKCKNGRICKERQKQNMVC